MINRLLSLALLILNKKGLTWIELLEGNFLITTIGAN